MAVDPFAAFLRCQDFTSALREALHVHYKPRGRVNLSAFSRRAGFSSRSYLSELLSGKKGLSRDALTRIRNALKLPRPLLDILDLLAYQMTPSLRPMHLSTAEVTNRLAKARALLHSQGLEKPAATRREVGFVRSSLLYRVYAALGSLSEGADVKQIAARTKLTPRDVNASLAFMLKQGLIQQKGERLYATESQIDNFGLQPNEGLSALVAEACGTIRLNRSDIIANPTDLVFYSAFSMDQEKAAQLKMRIREAVLQVLDEFQNDDGDVLISLIRPDGYIGFQCDDLDADFAVG